MKKAFLSHSSVDKAQYVRKVAERLGPHRCIIDELCFEEGMKTMEEIIRNMEDSDLFVIFLSKTSLCSDWVKSELTLAKNYEDKGILKRIYPIIIDESLKYDDPLFADNNLDWLVKEYNLQYNARPATAAKRIIQRLIELTWEENPLVKESKLYFFGRNDLIQTIEERFGDYDLSYPVAIIASGIPNIGRRSLLAHTFRKNNLYTDSYSPSSMYLSERQGVDDFILELNGLSIAREIPIKNLITKNLDEKLLEIKKTLNDISQSKDTILIIDDGSIILNNGEMSEWFENILNNQIDNKRILFQIASRYRLNGKNKINNLKPYIFALNVPELNEQDRKGFLKNMIERYNIQVSSQQFAEISNYLKGLPDEIFFIIELIKEEGVDYLMKHLSMIADFRSEKISKVIQMVRDNESKKDFDFLNLLSQFPYFSFDLLLSIEKDEEYCIKTLKKFSSLNIIEYLGAKDYMRINDAISDHVNRLHIKIIESYQKHITIMANHIKYSQLNTTDLSKFYFLTKELLYNGKEIPNEYIIPSILLNTIADLYEKKKEYQRVISLSKRILSNSEIRDINILKETRYWLCLALARERNTEQFFQELHRDKWGKGEYNFLLGFYYRLVNNLDKAIECINLSLSESPNLERAKNELVNAYIAKDDYDAALDMAKENYEKRKNNPYLIYNYARCLIITKSNEKELINRLLTELCNVQTDKAEEMYLLTKARYLSVQHNDKAFDFLNKALCTYPDSYHSILSALEIAERFKNMDLMKRYIGDLKRIAMRKIWLKNTLITWEQKIKKHQIDSQL